MANVNGTLTVMPPPPGHVVDFDNPQRHYQKQVYTAMIVENILALLFLLQRLFIRVRVLKLFQVEDGAALSAWILSIATQATLLVGFLQEVMGVHAWEVSLDGYELFSQLMFAVPLTYAICTACAKGSLCLFYGRLSPDVMFQIAVKATLVLIVAGYSAVFFSLMTIITSIIRLEVLLSAMKTSDQSWVIGEGALWIVVECNLLVICCCQPTLRLFFKHIAPQWIGERTQRPTYEQSNGRRLRTWGTMSTRPRRIDTLTGTFIDLENADNVPLELRGDWKNVGKREAKVISCQGKHDESEEAILFERSVEITYGVARSTHSQQSGSSSNAKCETQDCGRGS
ncbi:hypothetical protein OPT61_g5749 [Boeremia exigua]|uniref:Uncharacterized protein n=1 Tax=Boeremia exigua TaxID=749465 RepID=A0ACC2I962_9PLEO|nr:hypothetical protein OPT61_g5749 [Boeremia exigua]